MLFNALPDNLTDPTCTYRHWLTELGALIPNVQVCTSVIVAAVGPKRWRLLRLDRANSEQCCSATTAVRIKREHRVCLYLVTQPTHITDFDIWHVWAFAVVRSQHSVPSRSGVRARVIIFDVDVPEQVCAYAEKVQGGAQLEPIGTIIPGYQRPIIVQVMSRFHPVAIYHSTSTAKRGHGECLRETAMWMLDFGRHGSHGLEAGDPRIQGFAHFCA
jgi:hypothetical protein